VPYGGAFIEIKHADTIASDQHDYALLCADRDVAHSIRRALHGTDTVLIDNSSAYRMDPTVPLVVPEINGHLLTSTTKLIANPNCSTIMMLAAVEPLRRALGVHAITATTYQAVSGAGAAGIDELHAQTRAVVHGESLNAEVFPVSCGWNVFEHESPIDPNTGFSGEESKMIAETRRIWNEPGFHVLPTCVRVPVERAHAQSLIVELGEETTVDEVRSLLMEAPWIRMWPTSQLLTPRDAAGHDEVFVGRIRMDPASDGRRVLLWVCCDQVRKGAALNAIQIMDCLVPTVM
jgi:aspartate-semialdehyde dehydrogenase